MKPENNPGTDQTLGCDDLPGLLDAAPDGPVPDEVTVHLGECEGCARRYGLMLGARQMNSGELALGQMETAPGQSEFMSRLAGMRDARGGTAEDRLKLDERVKEGDRAYWAGAYSKAERAYSEALFGVEDRVARAALLDKIAWARLQRHQPQDALEAILASLFALGEPSPPTRIGLAISIIFQQVAVLWITMRGWLRRSLPAVFKPRIEYGDRSVAAQHMYRELSMLTHGEDRLLSRWAQLRELRWALELDRPLELTVAYGRYASVCASAGLSVRALRALSKALRASARGDSDAESAFAFYGGRVSYLLGNMTAARLQMERCAALCRKTGDYGLLEGVYQHLVRIYRAEGMLPEALETAGRCLSLYYKLGSLPRLSAICRHFALIYGSFGDPASAVEWAEMALKVCDLPGFQAADRELSRIRCMVVLADLNVRRGKTGKAAATLAEAATIVLRHDLPRAFFRDGMALLGALLEGGSPWTSRDAASAIRARPKPGLLTRLLRGPLSIFTVDLERTPGLSDSTAAGARAFAAETERLYEEYEGLERHPGLHETVPASPLATAFLSGELALPPNETRKGGAEIMSEHFAVGVVASRWGRGMLSKDRSGAVTSQLGQSALAPWGYFFAEDLA